VMRLIVRVVVEPLLRLSALVQLLFLYFRLVLVPQRKRII
jgi:hypothetical protein